MAENDGKLELGFSVDNRTLERGFRRAAQTGDQHLGALEKRAERAKERLSASMGAAAERVAGSIKGIGAAFAGGLLGGFAIGSLSEVPRVITDVAKSLAELKGEAQRAGIGVEDFQALEYAAKQSGVSVDALVDGIKELQLRADEFILTGKGSGEEAFRRLGYSAEDLKEKLKNPVLLFDQIIDRLRRFETAEQIRISDEIFGGAGGEQFVRFLDQGAKSLKALQAEARAAGVVLSSEIVNKGAEIDRAFQRLSDTISARLKGGIVSTADAFDTFAAKVQAFMTSIGNADIWRALTMGYEDPDVQRIFSDMGQARAELAKRMAAGERGPTSFDPNEWLYVKPNYQPPAATKGKSGPTPGERFDADVLKVREEIEALRTEQEALGKSAFEASRLKKEHELLAQARRDGVAISPEIRARIDEESRAFAQASADLEGARTKLDQARELQSALGSELTSSLSGLLTGTVTVNEALDSLVKKLIEAALQAALLGQGPLAGIMGGGTGIIGSIFGGFRAGGGDVERGKHYVVGEKGPELFAPGRSGSVIPNDLLRSIRPPNVNVMPAQAKAAPQMTFAPTINIQGGGGTHSQNRDLSQQMMTELRGMAREVFVQEARRQRRPQGVLGN